MTSPARHIHLDPVGGIAGDMFVAALLDAWPHHAEGALAAARSAGLAASVELAHLPFNDGILSGSRFAVSAPPDNGGGEPPRYAFRTGHAAAHRHIAWASLRQRLLDSPLPVPVKHRAIAIFELLAEAEATVHATSPAAVTFHEVGAWDSVADIVAAAYLIEQLLPVSWSVGAVPLGSGRVHSAHGQLPVPAPATVLLLRGLACIDDGHAGERVTPTGAAILRHLDPAHSVGHRARRLERVGYGFGTRRFEGLSNVLRIMVFEPVADDVATGHTAGQTIGDTVGVLRFEIDDQTAEDLAVGLEQLRALPDVIDVTQAAVTGKQGRVATSVQVLTAPGNMEQVARECFQQTTTIGIRLHLEARLILPRHEIATADGLRVKRVRRPGGTTAKTDIAELVGRPGGHAARARKRAAAEQSALLDPDDDDHHE